uniref:intramembrane prenyl-peptidase Rce1 n=1 Tax=Pseudo-nitzschia australis TaxID=44445 RepID=A0A7S4EQN0_9STRA
MIGMNDRGVFKPCVHRECNTNTAIVYCFVLAVGFVTSLYLFVPSRVRKLPRDHPTHIQFRSLACLIVCAVGILSYPYIFCDDNRDNQQDNRALFSVGKTMIFPSLRYGLLRGMFGVLVHTCVLYTGSSFAALLYFFEIRKQSIRQGKNQTGFEIIRCFLSEKILPDNTRIAFWIAVRNYCIAPLTEEIVFRGCMVPPLVATGMSAGKVSLVAPLFFGFAHLHHAVKRISNGDRPRSVMLATTFQFLYTSLFGSYASYAFVRSGSILPVILSHSYCNWMGLPNIDFVGNSYHPFHQYRIAILFSYFIGIVTFWYIFHIDLFLPLPSELPRILNLN